MKFRVRFGKQRFVVNVEHENGTVEHLKKAICRETSIRDVSSVQVSLNGVDIIEENDRELSSLGLVNGDLVYALSSTPDLGETSQTSDRNNNMLSQLVGMGFDKELAERALDQVNYASVDAAIEVITTSEMKQEQSSHEKPRDAARDENDDDAMTAGPSAASANTRAVLDNDVCSPVFCRDGVSAELETLYSTADVKTHHQAMFVLIHALMLESGFGLEDGGKSSATRNTLPGGWNDRNVVKWFYVHNLSSTFVSQLLLTSLGPFVYAHVWSEEMQSSSYEVKLVASNYVRGDKPLTSGAKSIYKNLHKVSRVVKNGLVHPLLASIQSYLGVTSPLSLEGLPPEIQLMVFSQLSVGCLVCLSATCKGLRIVCNDEKLWQFFCKRDFDQETKTGNSWKTQYITLYKRRKEHTRDRFGDTLIFPPEFPLVGPGFNPFLPRIPHIIGGPRDLFPDFIAGQPRDGTSLGILNPENRSRSDLRLRTGERATRGTFFA